MHLLLASAMLLNTWHSHAGGGTATSTLYRDGTTLRYAVTLSGHTQTSTISMQQIGGVSILDLADGYNVLVRPLGGGTVLSMHFDANQRALAEGVAQQIRSIWLSSG